MGPHHAHQAAAAELTRSGNLAAGSTKLETSDNARMPRVRELIAATGRDRRDLARMLGYGSENSLRQAENGKQALPADKLRWLERYAKIRSRHAKAESEWLQKNPAPAENIS